MTRKDYEIIAKGFYEIIAKGFYDSKPGNTSKQDYFRWLLTVEQVGYYLKLDNPQFDLVQFKVACGHG
jgi:hypothetical protein